ncbi:hypothetical protein C8J56DRAFT_303871 [Mycena floridula]|nr:hypothetical protein C8J56DRAFT_303871 [Mycena floridula]
MDADIYRGPQPPPELHAPVSSILSESSSTSSFLGLRRLGAVTSVVEQAITRWARRNRSASSASSSSSSSSSLQLSRRPSRRRRSSITSSVDFAARISLLKARAESRQVPREFSLYLPPSLNPVPEDASRVIRSSSLPDVLSLLDTALKRGRRNPDKKPATKPEGEPTALFLPDTIKVPSRPPSFTDLGTLRKGKWKHKDDIASKDTPAPKAWFLDVASPTSADMQAIGKLLHLHPLTLEDILHQDPREKLEHFQRLGYYFISFRAVAPVTTQNFQDPRSEMSDTLFEGNIYLVVFKEGICSFHFTDQSEHIDRVRNRIAQLEQVINMSSDWIAHGILDSIVDSMFPFLESIEKEVMTIEDLVFTSSSVTPQQGSDSQSLESSSTVAEHNGQLSVTIGRNNEKTYLNEKANLEEKELEYPPSSPRTRFAISSDPHPDPFRRLRQFFSSRFTQGSNPAPQNSTNSSLRRMARTRRLVTSLGRLLASKSEVVAQIRKRLLNGGMSKVDDTDLSMHLGDVQDHILTLQHSLQHYERMLSQSHPIYLAQLRTTVAVTKSGTDKALIFLTITSIAVLCIQTLVGLFSLNVSRNVFRAQQQSHAGQVKVPRNGILSDRYDVFAIILALSCLILCTYLAVVRRWWLHARRRRRGLLI